MIGSAGNGCKACPDGSTTEIKGADSVNDCKRKCCPTHCTHVFPCTLSCAGGFHNKASMLVMTQLFAAILCVGSCVFFCCLCAVCRPGWGGTPGGSTCANRCGGVGVAASYGPAGRAVGSPCIPCQDGGQTIGFSFDCKCLQAAMVTSPHKGPSVQPATLCCRWIPLPTDSHSPRGHPLLTC